MSFDIVLAVAGMAVLLGAALAGAWLVAGRLRARSREIHGQIVALNERLDARAEALDAKLAETHKRLAAIEAQLATHRTAIDERLDELAERLLASSDRLDHAEARLAHGDDRQEDVSRSLEALDGRLKPIEGLGLDHQLGRAYQLNDIGRAVQLLQLATLDGNLPRETAVELLRHLLELRQELEARPLPGEDGEDGD
jgi:hypothetical protein